MTTFKAEKARGGIESKNHRILKVLTISLCAALLVMLGLLAVS